jgi:decaprenyl-phosphate phosphoribosyltransferase
MSERTSAIEHRAADAATGDPAAGDSAAGHADGATFRAQDQVIRSRRLAETLLAVLEAARPRQWPKNLLVFAAPLAGASLGRDHDFGYATLAAVAFIAASAAVYLVNDVADAERDRRHPSKRRRPVASGRLPVRLALAVAVLALAVAFGACALAGSAELAVVIGFYVLFSLSYTMFLKHVPGVEVAFVAVGFMLRVLGGAVATGVPPSGYFLAVCSLGALMVALGKRYTELAVLGDRAATHRPVMRWYRLWALNAAQRAAAAAMLCCYLLWAWSEADPWMRTWHLISAFPLATALWRFDRLTCLAEDRPVEDLIARDPVMACSEVTWLALFLLGL